MVDITTHTEKYFRNLAKPNRNQIGFTIQIDLKASGRPFTVPNHIPFSLKMNKNLFFCGIHFLHLLHSHIREFLLAIDLQA